MFHQKTIQSSLSFIGIGIHSGQKSHLHLRPAKENTGIIFYILKSHTKIKIPLSIHNIGNLTRSVGLKKGKEEVHTIEHLLAALYILQITNIVIEVDNIEIPILDGSAFSFLSKIKKTGIKTQRAKPQFLESSKPFTVDFNDSFISYIPSNDTKITYVIDFPHPDLHNKVLHLDLEKDNLIKEISKARTFGFEKEVKNLLKNNLGQGGNLKNTVILTKKGYLNKKLRYPDECLRHKILDFLGDMYISNRFIKGHFYIYKSGHKLDILFLKKFFHNSIKN